MKGEGMRGLAVFIADIRNCKSKEQERKRINKELANIRSKFKGDKQLDGYQKKKYVCKLLFIFLLGNDIDFGYMEAVNLLSSNKYTEKQIGYLFISVLVSAHSDLMKLIIQSIKHDLASKNAIYINLALTCVADMANPEMGEALAQDIPKFVVAGDVTDGVKQNAILCMLKLFRTVPHIVPMGEWASRVMQLLTDKHLGVVTSACSLIHVLSTRSPEDSKACVQLAINRLSRIVTTTFNDLQDYTYYFVPAPWLSVKLLRLLQLHHPPTDPVARGRLVESLEAILNRAQEPPKSKKVQHSNAKNAVLFEAINLIIHLEDEPNLLVRASNQLGQYLQHRETNLRYLALEGMCKLARLDFSREAVSKHQETVLNALKTERDVSVRQRAVDLLYAVCDKGNSETIVQEMLIYLETADYSIREELVLKIAILAEKYAADYTWYVDTILNLIRMAGDFVSEEVWYRVVQIVINRDDVQGYAAKTVFEALQAPACHENMVKVGGYILGEFGNLIAGDQRSSPIVQFKLLHDKYPFCSQPTKALLLSTYMKFINLFPEISPTIREVLKQDAQMRNSDAELQQRSLEYLRLSTVASRDVLATVLEEMPPFPERESSLLAKLKKKKGGIPTETDKEGGAPPPVTAPAATQASMPAPARQPASASNGPVTIAQLAGQEEASLVDIMPTPPVAAPAVASDSLFDVFGGGSSAPAPAAALPPSSGPIMTPEVTETLYKFLFKHNGVLYENEALQIGIKAEYRNNLGRVGIFFGNKTQSTLTNFRSDAQLPGSLGSQLRIQSKPTGTSLDAGAQMQQLLNVECMEEFSDLPLLDLQFSHGGSTQRITVRLPIFANKFFSPTEMTSQDFFTRWKQLSGPQEKQVVFHAVLPIEGDSARAKLSGFGPALLEKVDPNPDNFVSVGILHTTAAQIGCLMRLEPNLQAKMYRLTIRSSKEAVSSILADLLVDQF
eukprot:m.307223 g.307223  ORF g.307223 m.307223 type:complete len:956 (+) comp42034_c0_seq1:137-3004(+)